MWKQLLIDKVKIKIVDDCSLVWIDKEEYENLIDVIDEQDRKTSMQFLQSVLPSTLRDELALQLCLRHCVYQEYPPDTVS